MFLTFYKRFGTNAKFFRVKFFRTRCYSNETNPPSMEKFIGDDIRNFSIIAHVDHGKSTLADRLLEFTGTIQPNISNKQVLDKLQVERERGITVKAQTSSMFHIPAGERKPCLFNLIDTPGHVDFSYEVSRSLAACQGALLIVDAAQGVQAQTVANFYNALNAGLEIIPVINKIDLPTADVEQVSRQINSLFDKKRDIVQVSAKKGKGIGKLLETIYTSIPSPCADMDADLSLLLFDSWFDMYRGVVGLVAVKSGQLRKGDRLQSFHTKHSFECFALGILHPNEKPVDALYAGQVGYIVTGIRDMSQTLIGETCYHTEKPVPPIPGFKQPTPMVFSGVYPPDQASFVSLKRSIEKLCLNDSSVTVHPDSSVALGQGWRIGFMGLLHMDVFKQRLLQEYNADVIVTTPNVPYRALLKTCEEELEIRSPQAFPSRSDVNVYYEPVVMGTLVFPDRYIGKVMHICEKRRGEQVKMSYIDESRILMKYRLPLSEIVIDFFDALKSVTSGFASFDYTEAGYEPTQIEKLEILLNGNSVDSLSTIVHQSKAHAVGKTYCLKLRETIPRQLFEVVIQASVRGKIVARETIKPLRKDVTAKCYGGDITRKRKLLERQKEGKKKLKRFGNVDVPHHVFLALLK